MVSEPNRTRGKPRRDQPPAAAGRPAPAPRLSRGPGWLPPDLPAPREWFDVGLEDGAVARVRRHGNPERRVRLFLSHGNGLAIDGYFPFWRELLGAFELILFDARNHGQNAPAGSERHDYAQMGRDMERIWRAASERLGPKPCAGVFHSMSAVAAMRHVVDERWHWDALALVDPPNVLPAPHPAQDRMNVYSEMMATLARRRRARFRDVRELAEQFERTRMHRRWVPGAHALMARAVLRRDGGSADWVLTCAPELEARMYLSAMDLPPWPPARELGRAIKLFIADPAADGAAMTGVVNHLVHEQLGYPCHAVPGSGHLLQIEQPAAAARAVVSFLEACGLTDGGRAAGA